MSIGLLSDLLSRVAVIGRNLNAARKQPEIPLLTLCQEILDSRGEATGLAHSQEVLQRYFSLSDKQKSDFFLSLLNEFGADQDALGKAVQAWLDDPNETTARALHFIGEPVSQNLLRRMNQAPNATLALVNMRADLLKYTADSPELKSLDSDFSHLFNSWFNRGFLELKHIDWETPASILEKIIAYEAVHEIGSWDSLRQRVASSDRMLYGYFHPALGIEPLIFVEVALTDHTPGDIKSILANDREQIPAEQANTAVFYSISNCQKGLKGISFGNFLIKQVVENLRHEFPNLDNFVTLSPVPGFRRWAIKQSKAENSTLSDAQFKLVDALEQAEDTQALLALTNDNKALLKLIAHYLVVSRSARGGASDPVSRFHLGNGARLENIHLQGDNSENGLKNSWGCMVNYQYQVKDIEKNHEAYINNDVIIASSKVMGLLKTKFSV